MMYLPAHRSVGQPSAGRGVAVVEGRGRFGPESFRCGHGVCGRRVNVVLLKHDDDAIPLDEQRIIIHSPAAAVAPSRHDPRRVRPSSSQSLGPPSLSSRRPSDAVYNIARCTEYATPPPSTHHQPPTVHTILL